jgi:hypothetical protein
MACDSSLLFILHLHLLAVLFCVLNGGMLKPVQSPRLEMKNYSAVLVNSSGVGQYLQVWAYSFIVPVGLPLLLLSIREWHIPNTLGAFFQDFSEEYLPGFEKEENYVCLFLMYAQLTVQMLLLINSAIKFMSSL